VGLKFLSAEWAQAVQDALNANPTFSSSLGSISASTQQVVTGPAGESRYWFKVDDGKVAMGVGDSPDPVDATITQDYDTAVALMNNELSGMAAYMSGKLRVAGDLMKLMQLQGPIGNMPAALQGLDIDYSA
jgi:putative sterol carrier protein